MPKTGPKGRQPIAPGKRSAARDQMAERKALKGRQKALSPFQGSSIAFPNPGLRRACPGLFAVAPAALDCVHSKPSFFHAYSNFPRRKISWPVWGKASGLAMKQNQRAESRTHRSISKNYAALGVSPAVPVVNLQTPGGVRAGSPPAAISSTSSTAAAGSTDPLPLTGSPPVRSSPEPTRSGSRCPPTAQFPNIS